MLNKVSKSRFDSREYQSPDGLTAFKEMTASVYDAYSLDDESRFYAETFGYQLNELMFTDFKCSNTRFRRTERHLQGTNNDFLVLHAQLSGEELIHMEHGVIRLIPGNIYLRDWTYTFDSQTTDMHIKGILIPRHFLKFSSLFNLHNPILSWSMSEPEGALIWSIWSKIFNDLEVIDLNRAESLASGLIGFLNGLCLLDVDHQTVGTEMSELGNIEQFLKTQLRGDISAENLCSQFDISRATLYRMFKVHGGLNHYIDKMRLDHCFKELNNGDPQRLTVSEVAAGWGYTDASVFNRKFRKQFGLSPSKVLDADYDKKGHIQKNREALKTTQKPYNSFKRWLADASGLTHS